MKEDLDLISIRKSLAEVIAQMNRHEDALPNTFHAELKKLKELLNNEVK